MDAGQEAAQELLRRLRELPPFERFPERRQDWDVSMMEERPLPAGIIMLSADGVSVCGRADLHSLTRSWEDLWSSQFGSTKRRPRMPKPVVERSVYDLRAELVAPLVADLPRMVPLAIARVLAAGGRGEPIRGLYRDPWLHHDTLQAAVAELAKVDVPPEVANVALSEIDPCRMKSGRLKPAVRKMLDALPARSLKELAIKANRMNESTVRTRSAPMKTWGYMIQETDGWLKRTDKGTRALAE